MAFGTITATVTPTLGLWVSFDASTAAGLVHYDITCASTGHTLTPVVSTATTVYVGQLRTSQVYTVTVTADATIDQVGTTTVNTTPALIPYSWEQILRQRLADIVIAANITGLYVVSEAYNAPRVLNDHDLLGKRTPILEIGLPRLQTSKQTSIIMRTNTYRVELLVADNQINPEKAAVYCQGVAAQIRAAIDATTCLNLFGIHDKSWLWTYSEPKEFKSWVSVGMILTIPVQEITGVMPYAT